MRKSVWLLSAGLVALSTPALRPGNRHPPNPTPADAATPSGRIADRGGRGRRQRRHRRHRPGPPAGPPGRSDRRHRGRRRRDAEFGRDRHPPAQPARAVAARLLDRHRKPMARPVSAASARSATIPASKARSRCSSTASIARARASASTSWARSTGSKCFADRRARCSAATPRPASSTSSPRSRRSSSAATAKRRSAITTSPARRRRHRSDSATTLAFRLDGVWVKRDGFYDDVSQRHRRQRPQPLVHPRPAAVSSRPTI